LRKFGGQSSGAISADRVAHIGQCLPRDLLDFADFFSRALRIAIDEFAGQF